MRMYAVITILLVMFLITIISLLAVKVVAMYVAGKYCETIGYDYIADRFYTEKYANGEPFVMCCNKHYDGISGTIKEECNDVYYEWSWASSCKHEWTNRTC